jgi:hypothetical protein
MKSSKEIDLASYDPAKDVHWTPLMALAWIIYRDMNRVREASPDFAQGGSNFDFKANQQCVVHPSDAVRELWRRLEAGKLTASGATIHGRRTIEKTEWCDLIKIDPASASRFVDGNLYADAIHMYGRRPAFYKALIPVNEILRAFPDGLAPKPSASEEEVRSLIRGELEKHDGFLSQEHGAQIVRRVFPGFPKKRAMELVKQATNNEKPGPRGPRRKLCG